MRIFTILSLLSLMSLLIVSCSSIKFSTENVMEVHQGMSSDEILDRFGKPKNISISVCGKPPNQWTCTTWEYGGGDFDFGRASFTFSGEHDSLILNNFDVDRD